MQVIRRRRAISTALAFVLAVESVASVSVAASSYVATRDAGADLAAAAAPMEAVVQPWADERSWEPVPAVAAVAFTKPDAPDYMRPKPAATAKPAVAAKGAAPKPQRPHKAPAKTAPTRTTPRTASHTPSTPRHAATAFVGRNHLWIPALGINRSVASFSCSRSETPGNYVYRWGCAGADNVYLFGHASSVFRPLHDAYVSHRLRVGMNVWYADDSGDVHTYAVQYWRVVSPVGADWAFAAQSMPSMTLQTCVGANSQSRLIVRLVQVG